MTSDLHQIRDQLRTLLATVEKLCAGEDVPNSHPRGETRFPGIARHAAALNVSRVHLFLVLKGERKTRKSASLIKRYQTLLAKEGRTFNAAHKAATEALDAAIAADLPAPGSGEATANNRQPR